MSISYEQFAQLPLQEQQKMRDSGEVSKDFSRGFLRWYEKVLLKNTEQEARDYVPKKVLPVEVTSHAFRSILEHNMKHKVALAEASKVLGEDLEETIESSLNPFYYAKDVVEAHKDHPSMKRMRRNGVVDMTVLKNAKTPNKQLQTLSRYKSLSDTLDKNSSDIRGLKVEVDTLKETTRNHEARLMALETLESKHISKIPVEESNRYLLEDRGMLSKETRAYLLRKADYSLKEVSSVLEVSVSTIKRWIARIQS